MEGQNELLKRKKEKDQKIERLENESIHLEALIEQFQKANPHMKLHQRNTTTTAVKNDTTVSFNDASSLSTLEELAAAQNELKLIEEEIKKTKKKGQRTLHIIPHSHTDEGWLSTTEDFFTGDDDYSIYVGSVKDILDSTIQELIDNENHTFTYSEMKYF